MTESTTETGVVTKLSPRSVADTTARLTGMIDARGMRLFALIDQREEALSPELAANLAGLNALTDALVAP